MVRYFVAQADNNDSAGSIPARGKRRTLLPVCTRNTLPSRSAFCQSRLAIEVDTTVADVAVKALMTTGLSSICRRAPSFSPKIWLQVLSSF